MSKHKRKAAKNARRTARTARRVDGRSARKMKCPIKGCRAKTKGPRYNHFCENHKALSKSASDAGLLDGPPLLSDGVTPAPSSESAADLAKLQADADKVLRDAQSALPVTNGEPAPAGALHEGEVTPADAHDVTGSAPESAEQPLDSLLGAVPEPPAALNAPEPDGALIGPETVITHEHATEHGTDNTNGSTPAQAPADETPLDEIPI